ncbi:MAG: hemerythrin domain-containing protein [Marinicaulis sp.]|nr:hemerythrin domain-containing protein [Marinicaulis sp.]NNE41025.1 hemerythrin domain-containing protein [Marinicaulis sp.]NNL88529.1 hemerythrin domain-containing protein [Marinicaulis sp.]
MMAAQEISNNIPSRSSGDGDLDIDATMWRIESTPKGLIDEPLDFLFAEHHRQRQAALILTFVADGQFDEAGVQELIEFLQNDFALHVQDEELGFFPILKSCCPPEDNIDSIVARLVEEHKKDELIGEDILKILKTSVLTRAITQEESRELRAFAEHIRQHLAFENAVLLPIARARMDEAALAHLSADMKGRRSSA